MSRIDAVKVDLRLNPYGDYRTGGSAVERREGLSTEQFEAWKKSVDGDQYRVICVGWSTQEGPR